MKDAKFTNLNPEVEQEIELTEDQLDEIGGGATGGSGTGFAAGGKEPDPFDKKKLTLNPGELASNPAQLLPYIRNTNSR